MSVSYRHIKGKVQANVQALLSPRKVKLTRGNSAQQVQIDETMRPIKQENIDELHLASVIGVLTEVSQELPP